MKTIILLFILSCSLAAQAQYGYGNTNRQRQRQMMQTEQKAPEPNFQIEKHLGIVIYDIEKAAKKSSVKLSSDEGKKFSKTLTNYNKKIKDIRRINSFTLRNVKEMVENFQKNVNKTGDFSNQEKVRKTMVDNLKPISDVLKIEDKELDKTMKSVLSDKQYNKWIKYNKKMYKFFPLEEE